MRQIAWGLLATAAVPVTAPAQQAPSASAQLPTDAAKPPPAPTGAPDQIPTLTPPPATTAAPASPQAPPTAAEQAAADLAADEMDESGDVVVTGEREKGAVIGDIPPEVQLGPSDIRAYGVSSVSELLNQLGPLTQSDGPPVILLNGRRISGFQEVRDLPTEAIERVDILPEEVAVKYGYRPDQKVVNFVLRNRFRSATVELSDLQATDGGFNRQQGDLDLLNIQRDKRQELHVKIEHNDPLLEAERDIVSRSNQGVNAGFDQRPYRTLPAGAARQQSQQQLTPPLTTREQRFVNINALHSQTIFGNVAATLNGSLELTNSVGQQGAPIISLAVPANSPFGNGTSATVVNRQLVDGVNPLLQRSDTIDGHLGATLNGDLGRWRWNAVGNYDRVANDTVNETGVGAGPLQNQLNIGDPRIDPRGVLPLDLLGTTATNRSHSVTNSAGLDLLFTGTSFHLPAGAVTTSVRAVVSTMNLDAFSVRPAASTTSDLSRDSASTQLNLDLPISSVSKDVLPFLGTLSLNGNAKIEHLSDFGDLYTYGYGATWKPLTGVRVNASVSDDDNAPSIQQLGNPVIITPNVRVFDYVRGVTSTATVTTGGNPNLPGSNRHQDSVGVTLNPWSSFDLALTARYVHTRRDNQTVGFPAITPAIEAAFPGRFTRDADGVLTRLDRRPVSYYRREQSQLRWGINFSVPLKSKLQKELEAFRAGTGPNPFAGLRDVFGSRRPGEGSPLGGGNRSSEGGSNRSPEDRAARSAERASGGFGGNRSSGGGGGSSRGGSGRSSRGGGGGRLSFSVNHTWHFKDDVLINRRGPLLDLLDGDTISESGGQPRHEVEGQIRYTNNGLGARFNADYQSSTRVNGLSSTDNLKFDDLTTFDLQLWLDASSRIDWLKAHPWLRGSRVTLGVDNLFNQRQRVTDATGNTPIAYQPDYLDPIGRTVRLTFRKLLF